MICRKCNAEGNIIVKRDYIYCEDCYLMYLNHKFRACIGKNKAICPNEKVLVALSGGLGSTALLDLIHTGITLNTHKKLRIEPQFVHLTGAHEDCITDLIEEQCKIYGLNLQTYNITEYTSCNDIMSTTYKTTINDVMDRIIQNVLVSIAKELKCRLIFTGEPATDLAAKLLSNIVIGRGSQVENDIGFVDSRHKDIKILRPLRDITKEELKHYVKIKSLVPARNNIPQNNIQSVIDSFVSTLEQDSPATISTICKTADKIGSDGSNESGKSCIFCKGKLDNDAKKLTAIQAIIFSRMVSYKKMAHDTLDDIGNTDEVISDQSMLPFIHQHLCYCCSRNYAELEDPILRKHILKVEM